MCAAIEAKSVLWWNKFKESSCRNLRIYLVISDETGTATVDKGSGGEKIVV